MTEADIVGGHKVEAVGERGHQVAKHLAAGRQTMEQQNGRCGRVASLPVEDLAAFDGHAPVIKLSGHEALLGG